MLLTVSPSDTADQFRRQLQLGLDAGSLLGIPEAPFDTPGTGRLSKDKLMKYRVPTSYFVGGNGDQNDQNVSGVRRYPLARFNDLFISFVSLLRLVIPSNTKQKRFSTSSTF